MFVSLLSPVLVSHVSWSISCLFHFIFCLPRNSRLPPLPCCLTPPLASLIFPPLDPLLLLPEAALWFLGVELAFGLEGDWEGGLQEVSLGVRAQDRHSPSAHLGSDPRTEDKPWRGGVGGRELGIQAGAGEVCCVLWGRKWASENRPRAAFFQKLFIRLEFGVSAGAGGGGGNGFP